MSRAHVHRLAAPLIALTLLFAACSSDAVSPDLTSTASSAAATAGAGASATATPPGGAGAPAVRPPNTPGSEPEWSVPVYEPDTRTANGPIDKALDAVLAGDAAALASVSDFRERPCTTNMDGIGTLQCPEGVAEDTPISVIQAAFCEGTFVTQDAITATAEGFFRNGPNGVVEPLRLYAIARIDDDPTLAESRYRLLLSFPDGTGRLIWVSDAGVTMLWWGCAEVAVTDMTVFSSSAPPTEYLLSPRSE